MLEKLRSLLHWCVFNYIFTLSPPVYKETRKSMTKTQLFETRSKVNRFENTTIWERNVLKTHWCKPDLNFMVIITVNWQSHSTTNAGSKCISNLWKKLWAHCFQREIPTSRIESQCISFQTIIYGRSSNPLWCPFSCHGLSVIIRGNIIMHCGNLKPPPPILCEWGCFLVKFPWPNVGVTRCNFSSKLLSWCHCQLEQKCYVVILDCNLQESRNCGNRSTLAKIIFGWNFW